MTPHHLARHVVGDVLEREAPRLGRDVGVEEHLVQHVAELFDEVVIRPALDRLDQFGALLDEVLHERRVRLLAIPRAAPGSPQAFEGRDELVEARMRAVVTPPSCRVRRGRRPGRRELRRAGRPAAAAAAIAIAATSMSAASTAPPTNTAPAAVAIVAGSVSSPPREKMTDVASAPSAAAPRDCPIERKNIWMPVTTPRSFHSTLDCAATRLDSARSRTRRR